MCYTHRPARRGTVLPTLGVCLIGLFSFVALAVDLGMLAVSRTQCQNAADVAALVGTRNLDNKNPTSTTYDNNRPAAVAAATAAVPANIHLSTNFTSAQVQSVTAGVYGYDPVAQTFSVTYPTAPPAGNSWTAMQVVVSVSQPTYFMRVMGVMTMPSGAQAVAVHRPRDVAFVLDMTGSMRYATTMTYNGASLNPDNLVPAFGHYASGQANLIATANQSNSSGEAISRNNYGITTPGGPPVLQDFYFDPANVSNPTIPAFPVTSNPAQLLNAFQRWNPPSSGGDPTNYVPPTYDFTGYNAFNTGTGASPKGPTPAPDTFETMTDSAATGVTYVGDRWRRLDGSINKTETTWGVVNGTPGTNPAKLPATTAVDLLGYKTAGSNVQTSGGTTITTVDKFRDAVWEANGYDLDVKEYRADRGPAGPLDPAGYTAPLVAAADRFKGYSMGPGYWGKTFYVWPPDPRTPVGNPGDATYQAGDWRQRYFQTAGGAAFNPQTGAVDPTLLNTGGGQTLAQYQNYGSPPFQINYPAVLKWIKSGPPVIPPNLRAGRILYYSSIPDDVNTGSGTTQQQLDKVFWKWYIDYVLGGGYYGYLAYYYNLYSANYGPYPFLYGFADSWSAAAQAVYTGNMNTWTGPGGTWASRRPYLAYTDSPARPRLQFWFGPLSMAEFIGTGNSIGNWNPGTSHEAQSWQLKAGMNSVLDDIRNNHPNDSVGLVDFAYPAYRGVRVAEGQDFTTLKNALFYPKSLLTTIKGGDTTTEIRPYDVNYTNVAGDEIPNANGGTDPNTGLAIAYNLLSPSANLPAQYGTVRGRMGASKVVIFETDGVPNSYTSMTFNKTGYNSYYTNIADGGQPGNGQDPSMSSAVAVVKQIVKPMALTTGGVDSGLSLPNAPAKVYPIGFGDLFDPVASPNATFRPTALQFLANIGAAGNTLPAGSTTIPAGQQITGPYQNRITNLRTCLQNIFQSGVSVTLIR
ncbi:MAG: von Willebrand factor type domain protein [Gemmataceae bacterium]|nr:von Willebrand factor type domain protein [Gemmataceae bacterium]